MQFIVDNAVRREVWCNTMHCSKVWWGAIFALGGMDSLTLLVQLPKSKICNWEPHSFFGHQHSSISTLEHLKTPYEAILEGTSHKNKLPFGWLARSCACFPSEMLSVSSFCTTAFQSCQAIPFSGLYPICSGWIASMLATVRHYSPLSCSSPWKKIPWEHNCWRLLLSVSLPFGLEVAIFSLGFFYHEVNRSCFWSGDDKPLF